MMLKDSDNRTYVLLFVLKQDPKRDDGLMLWTIEEKEICKKYERDEYGRIGCDKCPLKIKGHDRMCKAVAHYNYSTGEWEYDWSNYHG